MIIDYDHNQNLNTDRKLDSLKESVQMALNEVQTSLINLMVKPKAKEVIGLMDFFYPIGSYYETSVASFDPNTAWGGTWVLEDSGLVHVSAGAGYDIGDTGGDKDAIIPYHNHGFTNPQYQATGGAVSDKASFNTNSSGAVTDGITGGSHHHSIGSAWSSGSGSQTAYTMSSNRSRQSLNSDDSTHTHNLPNHTHSIPAHGHGFTQPTISLKSGGSGSVQYTGESVTDANMQPYIVVNRWHRTA